MITMANNTTVSQIETFQSYESKDFALDILIIIACLIAFVLNLLTIFVIWKRLWTSGNQLILSLAVGDASVGLIIPLMVCSIIFTKLEMDSALEVNCKMILSLTFLSIGVNVPTLAAISLERLYVVFFPLKAKMVITFKKMQTVAIVIWILSILSVPANAIFVMTKEPLDLPLGFCAYTHYVDEDVLLYTSAIPSFICSIITCVSYISIGCRLHQRAKQNLGINNVSKFEIKTCAVLCISMITYYLLQAPCFIVDYFKPGSFMSHIAAAVFFVNFLINPILYWFHPSFNKEYRKILGLKNSRMPENDVNVSAITGTTQTFF